MGEVGADAGAMLENHRRVAFGAMVGFPTAGLAGVDEVMSRCHGKEQERHLSFLTHSLALPGSRQQACQYFQNLVTIHSI
jgi:hypothetical protein